MRLPLLTIFGLLAGLHCTTAQDATLRLAGSDLLGDSLEPALGRYEEASGETVEFDFIGTLPALTALSEDRADLAILAIPTDEQLPEDKYKLIPIAYQVAFVYVNAGNPVIELSLPQLSAMFSAGPQERIERWGQLGQAGPISTRSVQLMVEDAPDSVVVEMFKYIALDSRSIKSTATVVTTARELTDLVAADLGAIGVGNAPPTGGTVKTLSISSGDSGSFAFGPTPENVYYGDYLLRLPFYIAVPKSKGDAPKDFIKALLSEETAKEFRAAGFMPLPENVRKRTIQDLDR